MNTSIKTIFSAVLALMLTSCGTMQDPYGNSDRNNYPRNYPNTYPAQGSNRDVYRANDGQVYRRGEVYRDRYGTVYQNGRVIRTNDVTGRPGILRGNSGNVYYPDQRRPNPNAQRNNRYKNSAKNKHSDYKFKKYKDRDDDDDDDDKRRRTYKKHQKSNNKYYKKSKDRDDD